MINRILTITTCVGALLAASSAANAQERWPRWYVGLSGSAVFSNDVDVDTAFGSGTLDTDTGWGAGVSVGYMPHFTNHYLSTLRFEGEIYYRENSIDGASFGGVAIPGSGGGDIESVSYMINALFDIKTGTAVTPYLGGGIGAATVDIPASTALGTTGDDDTVFAWQLMAGLSYEPRLMPHTIWSIGYRYHVLNDPQFSQAGVNYELDYDTHNIEAGVKFRF